MKTEEQQNEAPLKKSAKRRETWNHPGKIPMEVGVSSPRTPVRRDPTSQDLLDKVGLRQTPRGNTLLIRIVTVNSIYRSATPQRLVPEGQRAGQSGVGEALTTRAGLSGTKNLREFEPGLDFQLRAAA